MTTDTSGNYAYDFSSFSQAVAAGGSPAGMSFMSGSGAGGPAGAAGGAGGMGAGAPAAAGGGAPSGGAPSGTDASALIAQSPFGGLLSLPGVTAENLFSNVNPANYSGGNPFGALVGVTDSSGAAPYGGNPFASIGTLVTNDYNAATQGSSSAMMNPSAGGSSFGGV